MLRTFVSFALLLSLVLPAEIRANDIILDWNETLRSVIKADVATANPGWSTRTMAMANGAMYDVFMAIERTNRPFKYFGHAPAGISREAAAAQAAYDIILECYPDQGAILAPALADSLAGIPEAEKLSGIAFGHQVAEKYNLWRTNDGANEAVLFMPGSAPGEWRSDPFHPQEAWGPGWGAVNTFSMVSSNQFPLPGVPSMASEEYEQAFDEVKRKGVLNAAPEDRSADEENLAFFWAYDRAGMGPPPVLYSRNLHEIATQAGNTPEENARLFAMASIGMADAGVAAWDAKFSDNFWRPVTAIRAGELEDDDNPDTIEDPNWIPLGAPGDPNVVGSDFTPPFPAYPSGHATFGGALYKILELFYGSDSMNFNLTSEELPDGSNMRSFTKFSDAAWENAVSRIYLGIHWNFDADDGMALGQDIGTWVHGNYFFAVPEPGTLILVLGGLPLAIFIGRRGRLRGQG